MNLIRKKNIWKSSRYGGKADEIKQHLLNDSMVVLSNAKAMTIGNKGAF